MLIVASAITKQTKARRVETPAGNLAWRDFGFNDFIWLIMLVHAEPFKKGIEL
jgi:hypothetical protein